MPVGAEFEAIPDSILQAVREGYQDGVDEIGILPTEEADYPESEETDLEVAIPHPNHREKEAHRNARRHGKAFGKKIRRDLRTGGEEGPPGLVDKLGNELPIEPEVLDTTDGDELVSRLTTEAHELAGPPTGPVLLYGPPSVVTALGTPQPDKGAVPPSKQIQTSLANLTIVNLPTLKDRLVMLRADPAVVRVEAFPAFGDVMVGNVNKSPQALQFDIAAWCRISIRDTEGFAVIPVEGDGVILD